MPLFYIVLAVEEEEGISRIEPALHVVWSVKLECSTCTEESPRFMHVDEAESHQRDGATHHFICKCHGCGAANTVDVVELPSDMVGYISQNGVAGEEAGGNSSGGGGHRAASKLNGIVGALEVRGAVPTAAQVGNQWVVVSGSGARFEAVDLSTDWCDYDESSETSIGVSGASLSFEKKKKGM